MEVVADRQLLIAHLLMRRAASMLLQCRTLPIDALDHLPLIADMTYAQVFFTRAP